MPCCLCQHDCRPVASSVHNFHSMLWNVTIGLHDGSHIALKQMCAVLLCHHAMCCSTHSCMCHPPLSFPSDVPPPPLLVCAPCKWAPMPANQFFCALQDYATGSLDQNMRKRAVQLRELLTKLGPSFVKVGQALSSRPDLLPKEYLEVMLCPGPPSGFALPCALPYPLPCSLLWPLSCLAAQRAS